MSSVQALSEAVDSLELDEAERGSTSVTLDSLPAE
jgi:hypothetical protein